MKIKTVKKIYLYSFLKRINEGRIINFTLVVMGYVISLIVFTQT